MLPKKFYLLILPNFLFLFYFFQFNNFILRWYCTKAEANKKQLLITINMVKIYYVEADTKVRLHSHEHTTLISKQVHASTW